ncbi:MAG: hypothetical protein CFH01_00638 [Alphaproteobacteria bacterium MarineAlpha2_Bin1]|nr:MAG: hypothetical protein CFH01_00638 [Alphaproteobacteria bacterium MarineAlpha2_Bin1]|tara:strand:- start:1584 stop:2252 length:669 start_codon:yes stop_codon:yes gene_type:complete
MRYLHHFWLCPFSRKIRVILGEKKLEFELVFEKFWQRRNDFLKLNPAGQVPTLIEDKNLVLSDSTSISEYLEELYPEPRLIGINPVFKAEARRLVSWFDLKFYEEVTKPILEEKVFKRFMAMGQPQTKLIRIAKKNINYHLEYISWLVERRNWLVGDDFSFADISAASHISCLDYLDDIPWEDYEIAKTWYVRVKSRPSFRPLLNDRILGLNAPKHYANLDF